MMHIVDIESMIQFKVGEGLSPETSDLCCYINPQLFNAHIVDTPITAESGGCKNTSQNLCKLTCPRCRNPTANPSVLLSMQ